MSITNTTKPSSSLANSSKPAMGETWASITTTWASETHTWDEIGLLIFNSTKISGSITNTVKPA